jgi:alpha-1,3-rhamnosyl/mannosyltransferase
LYEGFGLPVLEAMSRGCPVIAADATALPEVVGDAGLLVPPLDVERWSDGLERVLEDHELRDALIERGLLRARDFDWGTAADILVDVYRRAPHP